MEKECKYTVLLNEHEITEIARKRIGKKYEKYINRVFGIMLIGLGFGIFPSAIVMDENNTGMVQLILGAFILLGLFGIGCAMYKIYSSIEKEKKENVSKMIREAHFSDMDDEI